MNNTDFIRPKGVSQGVLLNNNSESLATYKKAKRKFNRINELEEEVSQLNKKLDIILRKLDDRINNTD